MSATEVAEPKAEKPRPRWYDWVEKNSMPRQYNFPRPRREVTRWQKRGPMARRDWVQFYQWAAKKAIPKEVLEDLDLDERIAALGGKKRKQPKPKTFEELLQRIQVLARPLKPRAKYRIPFKPVYAYRPQIDPKKKVLPEKGRPIEPPKVPRCFQHAINQLDFWWNIQFPIKVSALHYNATEAIQQLALPKVRPPLIPHCPIPEKPIEYVPPRKRMNRAQWREHLRRLEYLAKPVYRPTCEDDPCYCYENRYDQY